MADIIKSIPSVWDETVVLPVSEIGEVAAFARRKGNTWFVAVNNGPVGKTVKVDLTFLGPGSYQAMLIRDQPEAEDAKIENLFHHARERLALHPDALRRRLRGPLYPLANNSRIGLPLPSLVTYTGRFSTTKD